MDKMLRYFTGGSQDGAWRAVILVRIMVAWVFILAGLRKFSEPDNFGAPMFEQIGIPLAGFMAPMVGLFEMACGFLLLLGLYTRAATIPLITIMIVALLTTKLPILMNQGFVAAMHASRLDLSMLLGCVFLLIAGSGAYAVDRRLR